MLGESKMTYIVWMVMLLTLDPVPQFARVGTYPSVQDCEDDKKKYIKDNNLTDQAAKRLSCIPVVTSKMGTS